MELSFDDDIRLIQAEMKLRTALVKRALVLEKNRHKGAANRLGIHRNTLTRLMNDAGIPLKWRRTAGGE
jgi:DNA-binding NtrC family response regulator